jgi:non-lysosomal glucosylceramidase
VRSNTCFLLEDGTFLGWEGCLANGGCCDGNCTHVWNYAQTVAFLFPELERSMRSTEFLLETYDDGYMNHRTNSIFGTRVRKGPAADGQLGAIVRLYREWKLSGDGDFLRKLWPNASRALDFALSYWDTDGDFVLDGQQHNTYDIEFYGPNSMIGSLLCAALKAAREIAAYLGDDKAERYNSVLEKSSSLLDEMLWNGEYYNQKLDDVDEYKHQYGNGCLSDQLLGQLLAHMAGLGRILPEGHVKEAMHSVYRYNFLPSLRAHHNVQRGYALNDEGGLVLCTWPHGGKPRIPFIYSDEVWTGCEYQAAAHMIYEGLVEEGLQVVQTARSRFDGIRRNPWNEYECGNHYARSMSSWALIPALSGFKYDMVEKEISFDPVIHRDNFRCFWSTGIAWGTYARSVEDGDVKESIEILHGDRGVRLVPVSGSQNVARQG